MKLLALSRLVLTSIIGFLFAGCAHNAGRGAGAGLEEFRGQQFPLAAGQGGTLTVTSFRKNGEELRVHPTSKIANGLRGSINRFIASLPASVKGSQTRITADFDSTADNHTGRAMATAALEAGLTLGVLGNNVPHDLTYHVDTTVTVTGAGGQSRTYHGSGDGKGRWMQQQGPQAGAAVIVAVESRAVSDSLDKIAAEIKRR